MASKESVFTIRICKPLSIAYRDKQAQRIAMIGRLKLFMIQIMIQIICPANNIAWSQHNLEHLFSRKQWFTIHYYLIDW